MNGVTQDASGRKTVLVVEDEPTARASLAAILSANGYEVRMAGSAGEALQQVEAAPGVNLVLLDMILRGSDGWQFLAARRRGSASAAVPVVVMTGLPVASGAWAQDLGATTVLRKPLDVAALLDEVRRQVDLP